VSTSTANALPSYVTLQTADDPTTGLVNSTGSSPIRGVKRIVHDLALALLQQELEALPGQ
jgi:hypothetical protein